MPSPDLAALAVHDRGFERVLAGRKRSRHLVDEITQVQLLGRYHERPVAAQLLDHLSFGILHQRRERAVNVERLLRGICLRLQLM